jgi:YesN/AraC family two-component response regulator
MSKAALNSGSRSEMGPIHGSRPALSILIVEDEKMAYTSMLLMITAKFPGVVINFAENGRQGVERFKEQMPDIVITDINMPGMDGFEMAEEIKTFKDDSQFIVLTGYSDKYILEKFSKIGVSDYIVKPIDYKDLFAAIDKCIAGISRDRP